MNVIVDTGGANLTSVRNALLRIGAEAKLTLDPEDIRSARRVILPGVGMAADSMARIRGAGLVDVLRALQQPLLGICVGMQLLYEGSEEGAAECLGIIPGVLKKIPLSPGITVPHMGWNRIDLTEHGHQSPLPQDIDGRQVYFVHSYAAPVSEFTTSVASHGIAFSASVRKDNFSGTQFHPEKSGDSGSSVIEEFLK